eukprot:TRINITY_DN64850_c0_g1_i1.p1 TRINITY_DN64850_c0_g1~~TRINITY_DN64850_c0_g1_i1.p1  ORF type:complete len:592 (+),score=132.52 TRINITY_DN64850_c0_g1_i1:225-1778(+)
MRVALAAFATAHDELTGADIAADLSEEAAAVLAALHAGAVEARRACWSVLPQAQAQLKSVRTSLTACAQDLESSDCAEAELKRCSGELESLADGLLDRQERGKRSSQAKAKLERSRARMQEASVASSIAQNKALESLKVSAEHRSLVCDLARTVLGSVASALSLTAAHLHSDHSACAANASTVPSTSTRACDKLKDEVVRNSIPVDCFESNSFLSASTDTGNTTVRDVDLDSFTNSRGVSGDHSCVSAGTSPKSNSCVDPPVFPSVADDASAERVEKYSNDVGKTGSVVTTFQSSEEVSQVTGVNEGSSDADMPISALHDTGKPASGSASTSNSTQSASSKSSRAPVSVNASEAPKGEEVSTSFLACELSSITVKEDEAASSDGGDDDADVSDIEALQEWSSHPHDTTEAANEWSVNHDAYDFAGNHRQYEENFAEECAADEEEYADQDYAEWDEGNFNEDEDGDGAVEEVDEDDAALAEQAAESPEEETKRRREHMRRVVCVELMDHPLLQRRHTA